MKIGHFVGMCALVGAVGYGCSSASNPGGGGLGSGNNQNENTTGDDGGGQSGSSSGGSTSTGTASGGGATSSGSGGTATSSGSSSGTASSGSGGNGGNDGGGIIVTDGAPVDDPEIDYSMTQTVTMSSFEVPAGEEVYYCQTFANPWGQQVDIKTYQLSMSPGSHHMFAFYQSGSPTTGSVAPCVGGGLTFGAFTFTSQTPHLTQTYPATIGATIPAGTGFQMMAHYLNTGTTTLTAAVSLTMYVAKPNVVTNHAGVIFLNNTSIYVPVGGTNVATTESYTLPQDVYILSASSHMHKYATSFVAKTSTGTTLYQTTTWDNPTPTTFSPPLELTSGTSITWTCLDTNPSSNTSALTFGESAVSNVMCIDVNIFYPVAAANVGNPVLGSAISSPL